MSKHKKLSAARIKKCVSLGLCTSPLDLKDQYILHFHISYNTDPAPTSDKGLWTSSFAVATPCVTNAVFTLTPHEVGVTCFTSSSVNLSAWDIRWYLMLPEKSDCILPDFKKKKQFM